MLNKALMAMILMIVLVATAGAVEIVSPVEGVYNTTKIPLNITSNQTLGSINYTVDSASFFGCTNCSQSSSNLNLSEGNHTISATGVLGNETFNDAVSFSILLPVIVQPSNDFTLTIGSPQNQTYNTSLVPISAFANRTLDRISQKFDAESFVSICTHCSSINGTLNLSAGNHSMTVKGELGNMTHEASAKFAYVPPFANLTNQTNGTNQTNSTNQTNGSGQNATALNLSIASPTASTYATRYIRLDFRTNINSKINYTLDNISHHGCSNCQSFKKTVELRNGTHELAVRAFAYNQSVSKAVSFIVNIAPKNNTPRNKTSFTGKFDNFNKLPQLVEKVEIADEDLAEIIRNNKLNPGVINRLIKTGKLGNASLEAIINTQFAPPGILDKLMAALGFSQKSFAELIYENYNTTGNVKLKLLGRDDLPHGISLRIKDEVRTGTELEIKQEKGKLEVKVKEPNGFKTEIKVENKTKNKSFKGGKQGKSAKNDEKEEFDNKGKGKHNNKGKGGGRDD